MDQEIEAMSRVTEALDVLDEPARARVIRWAAEKFGVALKRMVLPLGSQEDSDGTSDSGNKGETGKPFESLAELFAAASPTTDADKVLVTAYWHQKIGGVTELTSHEINKDLKNLGHGIAHINQKFDSLISQKPQLALQLKKSGLTKQARKKYKLTKAGLDRVDTMLTAA